MHEAGWMVKGVLHRRYKFYCDTCGAQSAWLEDKQQVIELARLHGKAQPRFKRLTDFQLAVLSLSAVLLILGFPVVSVLWMLAQW